jgi:hypothetical protein
MKETFELTLLVLSVLILVPNVQAGASANGPTLQTSRASITSSSMGLCWPQVGVFAQGAATVTGASVEIRILTPQHLDDPDSALFYWVGINLRNDAFIQTGYIVEGSNQARRFWEYFLSGTAAEASVRFLGDKDGSAGTNGTWVKYSITASGTTWSAFAGNQKLGSTDLKISSADENSVYAVAEVAGTTRSDNALGPVEFRNLSYRDTDGKWHLADTARAYIGIGAGSRDGCVSLYSIAEIPGSNNYWLAGSTDRIHNSGLYTYFANGGNAWPWYQLKLSSDIRCDLAAGSYIVGTSLTCQVPETKSISEGERWFFAGWTINNNRVLGPAKSTFAIVSDMYLTTSYEKQFFVNATSPYGQIEDVGWYTQGSIATISLSPTKVVNRGFLGALGVGNQFAGWTGDYSGTNATARLRVDSSKSIHAQWSITYRHVPELAVAVVMIAFLMGFIVMRKRSRAHVGHGKETREEFCLNCGEKLLMNADFCHNCGERLER